MFTEHQKKALDFERHLSVTANAGAGKTAVLVERFLDILSRTGIRINEIVAITFTEKAAAELRKKIAGVLEKRIQASVIPDERRLLEQIRGNLASAVIGTIHSFCAQLLREFPVEADIDAAFTILEGVDQHILLQEAIRETFESIMHEESSAAEREEFLDLIRMFGRTTVQDYLNALLNKREQVERIVSTGFAEGKTDEDILNDWNILLHEEIRQHLDDPKWKEALRRIFPFAKGKTAPVAEDFLKQWNDTLPLKNKIELYGLIAEQLFSTKNELYKKFTGTGIDLTSVKAEEQMLIKYHASGKQLLHDFGSNELLEANRSLVKITRVFLRLFTTCVSLYETKKNEFGQLDFEDLQLKARQLLQRNDIQSRLHEKYSYIMVDEFQDTNRLQYEILSSLVAGFTKGNLFIVGDPKQSIYGFRNAEVDIFEEAKSTIMNSSSSGMPFRWNDAEVTSSSAERNGSIVLTESFRMLPGLALFVNKVFRNLMSNDASRFDVHYDELAKARKATGPGAVEMMLVPLSDEASDEDDGEEDNGEILEARMIASRIAELFTAKHQIYDKQESLRDFKFGDVAVLFRSRLHILAIEQAFIEYNIPYVLSGGIGYYQTQEILDFYNYFKFLLNPADDIALLGILRSPFFAISDAELYEVSLAAGKVSFWEKIQLLANRRRATQHLRRAAEILSDDLVHANRMPIPFLVQRIFRQTGWQGTVAGLTLGRQHAANVQKLLRIARDFEGKGFVTLYDFVERLRSLINEEGREGQASIEEAEDAVKVMTIHAAKGLEFPVVILPFTHQKFRYDRQPFIDSSVGLAFKIKCESDYDEEITPPLYHYLSQRSKQKTEAEEKRILYVACTRAKDMLIISGELNEQSKHTSYLSWIMQGLELAAVDVRSETKQFAEKLNILEQHPEGFKQREISHQLAVTFRLLDGGVASQPIQHASLGHVVQPREIMVETLQGQTWGQFFSATHVKTYLECPTKYYLKYHLGLPEQNSVPYDFDENEEPNDRLYGERIGILTHAALQKIHKIPALDDEVKNIIASLSISESLDSAGSQDTIAEQAAIQVNNFLRSSFGREVLTAPETKTEFSLSMMFDNDFLTGTIDRLYKDRQGNWNIVDYKTDQISPEHIQARSELYKPQLAFYAMLVRKFSGQEEVRASLVFLRYPDSPVHIRFQRLEIDLFSQKVQEIIGKIKSENFGREIQQCTMCTYKAGKSCIIPIGS